MIQCPNCKATLPDWQKQCQFCHSDTTKVVRESPKAYTKSKAAFDVPKWVWAAYYGISGWWVIDGGLTIVRTFMDVAAMQVKADAADAELQRLLTTSPTDKSLKHMMHLIVPHPNIFSYFGVVIGIFSIILGIGLLLRNERVRGIVNFCSFLKLVIGACGIIGTFFAGFIFGPWALLFLILHVFNIFTAAMMIYLIGETDKVSY